MKQQILEAKVSNALACLNSVQSALEREDYKHAQDFLLRAISLLQGTN